MNVTIRQYLNLNLDSFDVQVINNSNKYPCDLECFEVN